MNNLGAFKCPKCGYAHVAISLHDAQEQVRQAQAFFVAASKINNVTTRGPGAYLEAYKRCSWCGASTADFVPALPGDIPDSWQLPAVIVPYEQARASLLDCSEAQQRVGAPSESEMGRPQVVMAQHMSEYEFTLNYVLGGDDTNLDKLLERLGAGGCTDALVGIGKPGCLTLEFTRESESLEGARNSAIADVNRIIPSATLLDEEESLSDFRVPDDFPRPQHAVATPGAQTKFLAVAHQGRYYSPGCTPPELYDRWQHCMHFVPQFVSSCIETKKGKRKDMPEVEILDQYLTRLIESGWVSAVEALWVIRVTAKLLGWPMPAAANGET
jgi:hypothetical protein